MSTTNKQFLTRAGVNLPAGTSTQAPLIFQNGTNLTTPVIGAMEWDGYNLTITEYSSNGTNSSAPATTVRRTLAYNDSTLLPKVDTLTANGTTQATTTAKITNDVVYVSGASVSTGPGYNGVILPPAVPGRKVTIINISTNPINIWPYPVVSDLTGVSSTGTTLNVSSTTNLYPGMILTNANFVGGVAKIISITGNTTVVIDATPTTALSGATVSISNGGTGRINGSAVNQAYALDKSSSIEMVAYDSVYWYTLAATPLNATGVSTSNYTIGDLIVANGATSLGVINDIAVGSVLLSGGVGASPTYGKVNLTTVVSGVLPVANGGTGTDGSGLVASGSSYNIVTTGVTSLNIGSAATSINIGASTGTTTINNDLTVAGNLIVSGDQVINNTTNTSIEDTIFEMNHPSAGWLSSDSGADIGTKFDWFKSSGNYHIVTGGSSTGTTCTLNVPVYIPAGAIITIAGVTPASFNGTFVVTSATSGATPTITYTSGTSYTGAVTTSGALGSVIKEVKLTGTSFTWAANVITVSYTGPALPLVTVLSPTYSSASNIITHSGAVVVYPGMFLTGANITAGTYVVSVTDTTHFTTNIKPTGSNSGSILAGAMVTIAGTTNYNGTYYIATASANSFTISKNGSAATESSGTFTFDHRYAFAGWTNDAQAFEYYKEGEETSTGVFTGTYGSIKGGQFQTPSSALSIGNTDITSGISLKIPTNTVYDIDSSTSATVAQGSVISVGQQTIGAKNATITYTNLASLYIANAPTTGSNVTGTNKYAIQVAAGNTLLGGDLAVNGSNLTTTQSTFNLLNVTATTINAFGAGTTVNIATPATTGSTATSVNISNKTTAATTLSVGTASTSASTFTFGGAITTGTNTVKIGSGTGGTVAFDSGLAGATATLFASTTGTVRIAEASTTVTLQNTTTSASTLNIATATGNNSNTLTYGGLATTATNKIVINAANGGITTLDAGNAGATGNLFPIITGNINIGGAGSDVFIGTTAGNSILEVRGNATSGIATIRTNSGVTTVSVFDTQATTGSLFNAAPSVSIGNAIASANTTIRTLNIFTSIPTATTSSQSILTFGAAVTSGTNKIVINAGTGATVAFDSGLASATATLFATTTGTVKLAENSTTLAIQGTTTSGTTTTIAALSANNNNTLTFGGLATSATNKIVINASGNGIATLDAGNSGATGNIFPIITGTVNYSTLATTVGISNTTASAVSVNIATVATGGASTLTFGGAVSGNTVKIRSTGAGTINLTTDVTSGSVNIFPSVTGTITLGSSTIATGGTGVVKLGTSPSQSATGTEVVTADWVINNVGAINSVVTDLGSSLTANQVIDTSTSGAGVFNTSTYRSAKYIVQATQYGSTSMRTQTSEILVTHDAPFVTTTGFAGSATGSTSVTLSNASAAAYYGLYIGMTVAIYTISGSDTISGGTGVITSITPGTSIVISTSSGNTTITSGTVLKAYVANPNFSGNISTTGASITAVTTTTGVLYPGIQFVYSTVTYTVTAISTNGSTVTGTLSASPGNLVSVAITGKVNIWMTEYAVLETNGTVATITADINASSPYNIRLYASPSTTVSAGGISIGTLQKTIFKMEKELIELA
jgi:hypothetical protein